MRQVELDDGVELYSLVDRSLPSEPSRCLKSFISEDQPGRQLGTFAEWDWILRLHLFQEDQEVDIVCWPIEGKCFSLSLLSRRLKDRQTFLAAAHRLIFGLKDHNDLFWDGDHATAQLLGRTAGRP